MFRFFTISLIFLLTFFGCDTSDNSSVESNVKNEPPKFNLSTPDKAVKSIIDYNIWYDTTEALLLKDLYSKQSSNYSSFFIKDALDTLTKHKKEYYSDRIDNSKKKPKIDKVDIQSDTRAEVLCKTDEMSYGLDHEKTLIMIKYTLSKNENIWQVEDIETTCNMCDGIGTRKSYKSIYSTSYDKCEYCGGDGWKSGIFQDK